jgi:hypothetical protein
VGTPPCSVKVHAEQDKACDISDNTSISQHESEAGSGSVQESNRGLALHFTYPVPLAGVNLQNNLWNHVHGKELKQQTPF